MKGFSLANVAVLLAVLAYGQLAALAAPSESRELVELRKKLAYFETQDIETMKAERASLEQLAQRLPLKDNLLATLAAHLFESIRDARHAIIGPAVASSDPSTEKYMLRVFEAYKRANIETDGKLVELTELAQRIADGGPASSVLRIVKVLGERQGALLRHVEWELKHAKSNRRLLDQVVL